MEVWELRLRAQMLTEGEEAKRLGWERRGGRARRRDEGNGLDVRSIYDHRSRLHQSDRAIIYQMLRRRQQRAVQGDDISLAEEVLHALHINDAHLLTLLAAVQVVREDLAVESAHDAADDAANLSRADDADRLAGEVHAEEAVEGEVPLTHPVVRAVQLTTQAEHQSYRVLADGGRRVAGDADDGDVVLGRDGEVDVVKTGAAKRDELQA